MSTVLTREAIKAADDRKIEPVEVPEWGGMLYVRGLSGAERDAYEVALLDQKKSKSGKILSQEVNLRNLRAKLIVRCAIDSDDPDKAKPLFTLDDIDWLGTKSGAALQRVYKVASELSGLSAEDVEELTEELGEGKNGDSGTDLPSSLDTHESATFKPSLVATTSRNGSPSTESSPSEDVDSTTSSPI